MKEEVKRLIVPYMGPLLVLAFLTLRHTNMLTERRNTRRHTAAAMVITHTWPLLVSYQAASSVGQSRETPRPNKHMGQISKTMSFLPAGKASKGNLLFARERKEHLPGVLTLAQTYTALIFTEYAFLLFKKPIVPLISICIYSAFCSFLKGANKLKMLVHEGLGHQQTHSITLREIHYVWRISRHTDFDRNVCKRLVPLSLCYFKAAAATCNICSLFLRE